MLLGCSPADLEASELSPTDEEGVVVPHDEQEISDACGLIRDFPKEQYIFDDNLGERRLSSAAMKESSKARSKYGGLSVNNEQHIKKDKKDPLSFLRNPDFGAARLIAGSVRELCMLVGREPLPDNAYHCNIWGVRTKSQQVQLARMATILREPRV